MKLIKAASLSLFVACLVLSCAKPAPDGTVPASADAKKTVSIVNLVENAVTRTEINTAEKWGERVMMGQVFEYLGDTRTSSASDLRDQEFHKARLHKPGGKTVDLWVYDWYTVLNAVPAVVVAESVAYKSDSLAAIEGTRVPVGTLVAAGAESNGFVEASWFSGDSKKKGLYLDRSRLSFDEADIAACRMLYLLNHKDTKAELKSTLLETALSTLKGSALYGSFVELSEQSDQGASAVSANFDRDALLAGVTTVQSTGTLSTIDEMNVRNKPSVSGSTVLSKIPAGSKVQVSLRTDALDTSEGVDSYWYFVENRGWVFGGFAAFESDR